MLDRMLLLCIVLLMFTSSVQLFRISKDVRAIDWKAAKALTHIMRYTRDEN